MLRARPRIEDAEEASLRNPYSVITVAGARNTAGAEAFAEWIVSPSAQAIIRDYAVERFGQRLFTPVSTRLPG
ncbi:MAG: hypothetical protein ACREM1_07105 [Longimicrobiales bacterium]